VAHAACASARTGAGPAGDLGDEFRVELFEDLGTPMKTEGGSPATAPRCPRAGRRTGLGAALDRADVDNALERFDSGSQQANLLARPMSGEAFEYRVCGQTDLVMAVRHAFRAAVLPDVNTTVAVASGEHDASRRAPLQYCRAEHLRQRERVRRLAASDPCHIGVRAESGEPTELFDVPVTRAFGLTVARICRRFSSAS